MRLPKRHKTGLGQKGVATILVVGFILFVILAFFAFAVDFAYVYVARGELQNLADASALAGAGVLTGTSFADQPALDAQLASVRAEAREYAAQNKAAGGVTVPLQDADIQIGKWDQATKTFTAITAAPADDVNAVWVNAVMYDSRGNPVDLLFGGIVGRESMDVNRIAVAHRTPGPNAPVSICTRTCELDVPPGGLVLLFGTSELNDLAKGVRDVVIDAVCPGLPSNDPCFDQFTAQVKKGIEDQVKSKIEKVIAFTEFTCDKATNFGPNSLIAQYIRGEALAPDVCGDCITTNMAEGNIMKDAMEPTYEKKKDANGNWRVIAPVLTNAASTSECANQGDCPNLKTGGTACSPQSQPEESYLVVRYAELLINAVTLSNEEIGNIGFEDVIYNNLIYNGSTDGTSYSVSKFNSTTHAFVNSSTGSLSPGNPIKGQSIRIATPITCVPCPADDLLSRKVSLVR